MSNLPVDLLCANVAHEVLSHVERAEETARAFSKTSDDLAANMQTVRKDATDSFARNLLLNVSQRGSDFAVRKALAALGCPAEEDQIWARLEAAREAQKRETDHNTAATN